MLSEDLTRTKINGMRENEKELNRHELEDFILLEQKRCFFFLQLFEDDVEAEEDRLVL